MAGTSYNLDELSQAAQAALLQALQVLAGAEAAMDGDRILVNLGAPHEVRVRVLDLSESADSVLVYLAVQLIGKSTGEQGIFDILTGIERDVNEAILAAVRRWIRFTFPPIRAAFLLDPHREPGIGITQLVVRPDFQWTILLGNAYIAGSAPDQSSLRAALQGESSPFPGIAGDLVGARLNAEEPRMHWLKLVLAFAEGEKVVECQFDNAPWPELDALLTENFWFPPLTGDFISMTQFVIMRPD